MFDQEKYPQPIRLCILNTFVPDNKLKLRGKLHFYSFGELKCLIDLIRNDIVVICFFFGIRFP